MQPCTIQWYVPVYEEYTPSERAAILSVWLVLGWQPTTEEVACRLGITRGAAWRTLSSLSRVIALVEVKQRWMWVGDKNY